MNQTEMTLPKLNEILNPYRGDPEALIPVLQEVQEVFGYIPPETFPHIAGVLKVFPSQVQGVITFYSQFYTYPRGRNVVRVCRGTACHVRGGRGVLRVVQRELNLEDGETTPDSHFTLETVACLGACALAPVMVVNRTYYGKMNPRKIETVLHSYR
ncbi:MAG: NADH-quinone oxidoreductase subunit NuoE [Syntrophales bacterium]|nr:NADH-quinone oxidoreductase subunit NuoE [Syntrophales bacterium]